MHRRQRVPFIFAAALVAAAGTLLLLFMLGGAARLVQASPGTLCVAPGGGGCDPGVCGTTCYASVQDAVNNAISGDEILVATGIYTDVNNYYGHNQVVYVNKSVTIRGGYNADLSAWDPDTYPATLDAGGQGRVIYITGDISPTLEVLRLTNGSTTASNGGGIQIDGAHPIISGCQVYNNTADWSGGGIAVNGSANVVLAGNRIYSNTANFGGGLDVDSSTNVTLAGSEIYSNTALYEGGGAHIYKSGNTTLTDNKVHNNTARYRGGGVEISSSANATLANNMVLENRLSDISGNGAGIYFEDFTGRFLHTTIAGNSGGGGQGVYVTNGATAWTTNTILLSHTVGVEVTSGATATLNATLWGADAWANITATVGSNVFTGTINIRGNPAFVDPTGGDYHIGPGSAALNAGVDTEVDTDIDGETRIGTPDLGADEFITYVYLPLVLRNHQ